MDKLMSIRAQIEELEEQTQHMKDQVRAGKLQKQIDMLNKVTADILAEGYNKEDLKGMTLQEFVELPDHKQKEIRTVVAHKNGQTDSIMSRKELEQLPGKERASFILSGGKIVDD